MKNPENFPCKLPKLSCKLNSLTGATMKTFSNPLSLLSATAICPANYSSIFSKKSAILALFLLLFTPIFTPIFALQYDFVFEEEKIPDDKELVIYVTAYDWGPAVEKIVLNAGKEMDAGYFSSEEFDLSEFEVTRETRRSSNHNSRASSTETDLTPSAIFLSDAYGNKVDGNSKYLTVLLEYPPESEDASPFTGSVMKRTHEIYGYRLENDDLDLEIYKLAGMVNPLAAKFKVSELVSQDYSMSYAYYNPPKKSDAGKVVSGDEIAGGGGRFGASSGRANDVSSKIPLIVWLHGISEGGRNPYIPLFGIKSVNLASDDIQKYFENGVSILIPQCPTTWLETTSLDSSGMRIWEPVDLEGMVNKYVNPIKSIIGMVTTIPVDTSPATTVTAKTSYYTNSLMDLIETFCQQNPNIDKKRIYIGGCSAGGYMTLNMLVERPNYFAAAFPTCEVYVDRKLSDDDIAELAKVPLWFIQAKTDTTAKAATYVTPTYKRLQAAGAKNLHLTMYDGVFDTSGKYFAQVDDDDSDENKKTAQAKPYEYPGHYSWMYVLNNDPKENGKSLFQWISEQKK